MQPGWDVYIGLTSVLSVTLPCNSCLVMSYMWVPGCSQTPTVGPVKTLPATLLKYCLIKACVTNYIV